MLSTLQLMSAQIIVVFYYHLKASKTNGLK